jgi:hypothetical protein
MVSDFFAKAQPTPKKEPTMSEVCEAFLAVA